jgi:hypothetical protein
MRAIKDLTHSEFPGTDPLKFAEWQMELMRAQEKQKKAMWIMLGICLLILITTRARAQ